ncbi:delta14-sterol reductase [Angomonas deanei]|nr:delta14-sterol reductase [Angomonas deanei]|eukprot:EPY26497.1 delta14-sterol reductase [Angomonas deanei]
MAPKRSENALQPKTTHYEWGGPFGGFMLVVGLPLLVLTLNSLCHRKEDTCSLQEISQLPQLLVETVQGALPDLPTALLIEVLWLAAHALFYLFPIGKVVSGLPLRNGEVLQYRINAIHAFFISHIAIFFAHYYGYIDLVRIAEIFPSLMLGAILISYVMSLALYFASYRSRNVVTALGGNSGNFFYDFWIGRELNPRTGFLDWKFFCELRPGLIGWSILNWSFVAQSLAVGTFTPSIFCVALFETLYVLDGLLLEVGNLTMMDIVTDGFGFMLCFGDLTWVPFIYTLQTKYLVHHPVVLSPVYLGLCTALVVLGYTIFRGANTQKDIFRTNPKDPRVAHLKVMKTSAGKSLITSGYWGCLPSSELCGGLADGAGMGLLHRCGRLHLLFPSHLLWHFAHPPSVP